MKWFFGIRLLVRLLTYFWRELREGNPYALAAAALMAIVALTAAILWFARRPLGGDPERPPVTDDDFRDDRNPYRDA